MYALIGSLLLCSSGILSLNAETRPKAEIVVTGERANRTILDTASSVQVLAQESLADGPGDDRVEQLLAGMANVQLGSGTEGPAIRGDDATGVLRDLPAFLGGNRPRMTLQVDGRAVSFNEFIFGAAPLWDVKRIEVFRSPQTTTQGRNSISGALFVETNDPEYAWNGRARFMGTSRDSWQASGALNGSLIEDQLAFRVAGDLHRGRSSSRIADRIEGANPNRDGYELVRVKLLAEPQVLDGARLETTYTHTRTKMPQIEGVLAPFKARRDPNPGYGVIATNVDSVTGVLTYAPMDALDIRSTLSWGDAHVRRFAPPGLGETRTHSRDVSVETIVQWKPGGALDLTGGINRFQSNARQAIDLSAVIGIGSFSDRQRSLGLFGEATFRPFHAIGVTAGLRYQRDSQLRSGRLAGPGGVFPIAYDHAFQRWLPKLSLSYELASATKAGILVQRAYNPGGIALNLDTGEQIPFGAETLWNYEVFVRSSLAEGRVTLSANLFRNDMRNAQRARLRTYAVPGGAVANWAEIHNVPKARSFGLEAQLAWQATPRLALNGSLGLLRTRIRQTIDPSDPLLGRHFQRAPRLSASAGAQWRPTDHIRVSTQVRHNAGYFSDDLNSPSLRVAGSTVIDGRIGYDFGRWTLSAFGRNLSNRFYLMQLSSPIRGTAGDPREVGLGLEGRF